MSKKPQVPQKHINNNGKNKTERKENHMRDLEESLEVTKSHMATGLNFPPPDEIEIRRLEVSDNLGNPCNIMIPKNFYEVLQQSIKPIRLTGGEIYGKGNGELYFYDNVLKLEHKIKKDNHE